MLTRHIPRLGRMETAPTVGGAAVCTASTIVELGKLVPVLEYK
jgi:hypothetical protein